MTHLFLEMPVTADTLVVGISLPARHADAINRAAELLRQQHPEADDDEIMRQMLLRGVVATIYAVNSRRWPPILRNEADDRLCDDIRVTL